MNPNILATTTYQAGKAENKPALSYGSSNLTYLHCSSKNLLPYSQLIEAKTSTKL